MSSIHRSPMVYGFFFVSGITALVYEIIWTRMLTLVFGHTVYSVSVVLAAFMAGLGFGSYVWGHVIDRAVEEDRHPPLVVYAFIEILIFASAALLTLIFYKFHVFYAWFHQFVPDSPALFAAIKALLAFLLMFVPTTFMGATLPIISKYYVTDDARLGTQVGYLYALNTLGASAGCLLTGFIFISLFGVVQTALLAAAANLIIGIGCIRIYQEENPGAKIIPRLPKPTWPRFEADASQKLWMAVAFISGLTALAYEVLWTRLLVFSIASTVYSFSIMLAVFLLGICLGSVLAVPVIAKCRDLRNVLMVLQAGIAGYVTFTLFNMEALLSTPWNSYDLDQPFTTFWRYLKDSSALMLVPTTFLGMSLPILIKLASGDHAHVGGGTGRVYAANTVGAIFGSLVAGFVLLPLIGTEQSLVAVATLNLFVVALLFRTGSAPLKVRKAGTPAIVAVILVFTLAMPGDLLNPFFMRDSVGQRDVKSLLYFEEGLTDTVAVFEDSYGILDPDAKRLITNGISMSASNVIATRYMKLFAHVPILLSDTPDNVLVICFGTGQTTGAAGIHPRVKSVDSIELSSSVINAAPAFAKENHDVVNNDKVNIVIQDGRNFLLTTGKKYDVITGEPPPPRTAFTVNLYTRDFYEQALRVLKPGGIVAQWVPLHSQSALEVDMHFKTFLSVFPHAQAWMSVANEMLLIGSDQPIDIDLAKLKTRFAEPRIKQAMEAIHIPDVHSFLANIWFLEEQLHALAEGQPLITDNRPRIEFYLDYGNVVGMPGLERIVFNRVDAGAFWQRVKNADADDEAAFRSQYRVMDLYQRGVMYANREMLLEAMRLASDDSLLRYHLQAGEPQIQELLEQVEADPKNLEALLNLGHSFYQLGQYEKSLEFLNMVQKRQPENPFAALYTGYDLMELGRLKQAEAVLKDAVRKNPGEMRNVMQQVGLIDLLQKLEENPGDLLLLNAAAKFYNVRGEHLKSLEYSSRVLAKDSLNREALQSQMFSYRGLGQPREVIATGFRYGNVDPDDLQYMYLMAEMYIKILNCEKAIPFLEKILAVDDTYQNAQRWLDRCQKKKGEAVPAA
ncbi:fused MFS/spermidine synthase [Nitrospina gracilis]|uniref:fused MFS/spermidine synthase n=1 Tax=Nitrospina gracilis TaxID=35801 RepID=UPI001F1B840C|nr:fused MFS/spermidine synthase [Nitrospina gracilis]MCF8719738.1 putative membrane-bound spermidine synthase/tetratricopeptide (TPR) repeat protein [Nitrospina gracilis Nb-211]